MGGACAANGADEKFVHIFGGKAEGKKSLPRRRSRSDNNIKMNLKVMRREKWTVFM
jgi:hypothetical protein